MGLMNFRFSILLEFGALAELSGQLGKLKIARPLICTDPGLARIGILDRLVAALDGLPHAVFDQTPENPTEAAVLKAAEVYRAADCDGVVALGGGSSMDLAKAVAVMVAHDGDLMSFTVGKGGTKKIRTPATLVAVPTIAGTGSEVSSGSVIVMETGEKLILAAGSLVPRLAICDPELTLGLPPLLTAATGMDCVTHCIEAILVPADNPMADAFGFDGLTRAVQDGALERAVADGQDRDARKQMMVAASEGALAFNKGLGAVHSMSHAAGRIKALNLHHGTLNAVLLPTVLRFNHGHAADKYDRIARAMGLKAGSDLAEAIEGLNRRIGLPANLKEMGVTGDMVPGMVSHALADICTYTNPRKIGATEYEALFAEQLA
ncbi:MAG: iron-containing alcohol dehydrogenase [Sneathiellaceae bacterium]